MDPNNQVMRFFFKIPSLPLAYTSMVVYLLFSIYLTVRVYRTKSARFLYILGFTALMEAIGYAVRIACADFTDFKRFITSTLFLLLAPNALALVNYKAVGEIIRLSNVKSEKFYLRPKFVTWFFFASDIFVFLMQGAGSGMQSDYKNLKKGQAITLIGLALQLVFLACFAAITVYVQNSPKYNYYVAGCENPKKKLVFSLYVTISLIYVRSIYRVVEYAYGYTGPVVRAEWALYVFDTLAIAICFLLYCIFFIGNYLPKHDADPTQIYDSESSLSVNQTEKSRQEIQLDQA
ncbi:hypothetical protein INT47_010834 [Mucor saturninus]|uniref:Uncharacterized protein n=1 Tax=Mucor saturninus TaxID=64648 RepID=A0A8H7V0M1_9FUNG|nr:hypothetical protein INT47_010834 [Mucor saturninus]